MSDLLPCQKVHYLHVLRGGASDGSEVPSEHWYESLAMRNGEPYVRDGEPEPMESNWQALSCDNDYSEPVWMKAPMRLMALAHP